VIDWFANEYEFVSDGRALRIDRLVKRRDTQTWWIVDFKSASQPERSAASIEQMNRYHGAVVKHLGVTWEQVRALFVAGDGRSVEQLTR
jgi:ATP-dependent helicase/nuclease subunit A